MNIVSEFLQHYENYKTPKAVEKHFGRGTLQDITEDPRTQFLDLIDSYGPLPPGYNQKVYSVYESPERKIILEFVFHGSRLVNLRIQMVSRDFRLSSVTKYVQSDLYAVISGIVGKDNITYDETISGYICGTYSGLIVIFRAVADFPSVSTHITDKDYA